MRQGPVILTIVALAAFAIHLPAAAIVNGKAPAADDTRFDAVASHRWSNKILKSDPAAHGWSGSAVLIAPDVVLTAKHVLIAPQLLGAVSGKGEYTVRFRRHQNGTLGSKEAGPDSYHHVRVKRWISAKHTDLALGILEEPVKHIKPVTVRLDSSALESRPCILAGWGSTSRFRGASGPRLGLRIGENTVKTDGAKLRYRTSRTEKRDNGHGHQQRYFIEDHAVVNMHDSGGSVFVLDDQDKPVLAGIIATYSSGVCLAKSQTKAFPIKAATKGASALLDAIDQAKRDQKRGEKKRD